MKKSIIIGSIFLVFLVIPYLIDFFVIGNETVKINVKNSDFFSFLCSAELVSALSHWYLNNNIRYTMGK